MVSDSAALRLAWDIQNILFQHEDDPEDVPEKAIIAEVARLWEVFEQDLEPRDTPSFVRLMNAHPTALPVYTHLEDQAYGGNPRWIRQG